MRYKRSFFAFLATASLFTAFSLHTAVCDIISPEAFTGHETGADYSLTPWDVLTDYFMHLDEQSDRIHVQTLGSTPEGRPLIMAIITADADSGNLSRLSSNLGRIADPRLIRNNEERRNLIENTRVGVMINCNLHANEIGSSEMSMELAWHLATDNSPETQAILEHTVVLLVPSSNPDGRFRVVDWYARSLGTPWEGEGMPRLTHPYAGHDNNRDWFMLNLSETQMLTRVLYKDWFPNVVYDIHQMGNNGPRFVVPPYYDPRNPNIHPLTDDMLMIIGGHMSASLTRAGLTGTVHDAVFDFWWHGGFRSTVYRHNMIGILTEAASVNIASPIFQRKRDLSGIGRGMPSYRMSMAHPQPWPGGWWRIGDIIDYEQTACMSLLTLAARYHDLILSNSVMMAEQALTAGRQEPPYAWLVPPDQHDPGTALKMLGRLHACGIEIHRAVSPFTADDVEYPAGTFIMYCAQPYRNHLMDLMDRQEYPYREGTGGQPERPYDSAGWTLPFQMGVRRVAVMASFPCETELLDALPDPQGTVSGSGSGYLVRAGSNDEFTFINRCHASGIPVNVIIDGSKWGDVPDGSLYVPDRNAVRDAMPGLLDGISCSLEGSGIRDRETLRDVPQPRIGIYQAWTGVTDEGWTRYVLDSFEYEYTAIHNAEIRAGRLHKRYECLIVPSQSVQSIINGQAIDSTSPEYAGGIGIEGIISLQDFVREGGTLICLDQSSALPIEHFNIPVKNIVDDIPSSEFYCPGSILRVRTDPSNHLCWGLPEWISGYFRHSQAYELITGDDTESDETANNNEPLFTATAAAWYSDTVLLESGWLEGGETIRDHPSVVEVSYGDGHIILAGFRIQHRGQTHGTFRLLFNAIRRSTIDLY